MYHFIYKTVSKSGKYYIGRHSTKDIDDGYIGSGKWVRSIKDKKQLKREILLFCEDHNSLLEKEQQYILDCISDPMNMNFNDSSVGFGSGKFNPCFLPHVVESRRKRMITNNPVKNGHSKESKKKISDYMTTNNPFSGKTHTDETKQKISQANKGKVFSEEHKNKLSLISKEKYAKNKITQLDWTGKTHSQETLEKMSNTAKKRKRETCEFCNKEYAINTFVRWHGIKCKQRKM